jgi:hypothetical protein
VYRDRFFVNKTNRRTVFQILLVLRLYMFRAVFLVISRISALVQFMQFGDRVRPGAGCASSHWWWAERLPETCRVVIPIKFGTQNVCWFYSQWRYRHLIRLASPQNDDRLTSICPILFSETTKSPAVEIQNYNSSPSKRVNFLLHYV